MDRPRLGQQVTHKTDDRQRTAGQHFSKPRQPSKVRRQQPRLTRFDRFFNLKHHRPPLCAVQPQIGQPRDFSALAGANVCEVCVGHPQAVIYHATKAFRGVSGVLSVKERVSVFRSN